MSTFKTGTPTLRSLGGIRHSPGSRDVAHLDQAREPGDTRACQPTGTVGRLSSRTFAPTTVPSPKTDGVQ